MQSMSMVSRFSRLSVIVVALAALAAALPARQASAYDPESGGYVVEAGDTLSHIALYYGVSIEELIWLNGLDDPDLIVTGQVLQMASNRAEPQVVVDAGDDAVWVEPVVEDADEEVVDDEPYVAPECCPPYADPETVRALLVDTAERYGWDPTLIMAQAWQESYWGQDEVSWVGAIGVMQVMPATAAELDDWYFEGEIDIWNSVADNIEAGVAYLTILYEETGSVELALASYYQGWGSVQRDGWFSDTHEYVDRIFMFQEMFQNGEL